MLFLEQMREEIILHQDEILKKPFSSSFYDFLEIGLLDFSLLYFANELQGDKQTILFELYEKSCDITDFFEQFCKQFSLSIKELISILNSAILQFYNANSVMRIHLMHVIQNWPTKLHEKNRFFSEYTWNYVANADGWIELLEVLLNTYIQHKNGEVYLVINYFLKQMEYFPQDIQESILINIGLKLGYSFWNYETKTLNYSVFHDFIVLESEKRKKAQKRAKVCGN